MLRASPLRVDVVIVKSSGTDVEKPAIFPTVLAFKFKFSANFLKYLTRIYLDTITISPEYKINFPISKYNFFTSNFFISFYIYNYNYSVVAFKLLCFLFCFFSNFSIIKKFSF